MSLTSILTNPYYRDFKTCLKENTLKPQFLIRDKIRAPPLTKNYSIVGQAFDYLLRFYIEQHNIMAICDDDFLAQLAYKMLDRYLRKSKAAFIGIGYRSTQIVDKEEFHFKFSKKYLRSLNSYATYYDNNRISDALLKACLFFARLDLYVRAGLIDTGLIEEEDLKDVEDLKNLLNVYKTVPLHKNINCALNPTFGAASALVGGADIDLVVEDMLVEIKTSTCTSLRRVHFDQVFCYYILFLIGGLQPKGYIKRLNKIGIYYARHGLLWQAKISDIASKEGINNIKNYMIKRFSR
jgi:hypothetical protein